MLVVLAAWGAACVVDNAPPEPVGRGVSATVQEEPSLRGELRHTRLSADYARASGADEAARRYDREHPLPVIQPPTAARSAPAEERTPEGGIPDARFLADADLALGSGMLVADVSFLTRGERDDYALERTGRFRETTTRYRVRVHGLVRRAGLLAPDAEFDLFTRPSFVPVGDGSGEAPRMLVVLGDHALRPGFNLKVAAPLGSARGSLRAAAYGAAEGTASIDLLRDLRARAARFPAVGGGA